MTWSLTKFWHSDQRFIKNILTHLLLKIYLKYLCMCILQLLINMLFTSFWIWQQLNTPALWILMNIWVYRWCHECVYMTFSCKYVLVCNFLLEMLTSIHAMLLSSMGNSSNVSIKLKFTFVEKVASFDKIIDQQIDLSRSIQKASFNFMSFREICKEYAVTSNCNLLICKCFRFQVWWCLNFHGGTSIIVS